MYNTNTDTRWCVFHCAVIALSFISALFGFVLLFMSAFWMEEDHVTRLVIIFKWVSSGGRESSVIVSAGRKVPVLSLFQLLVLQSWQNKKKDRDEFTCCRINVLSVRFSFSMLQFYGTSRLVSPPFYFYLVFISLGQWKFFSTNAALIRLTQAINQSLAESRKS